MARNALRTRGAWPFAVGAVVLTVIGLLLPVASSLVPAESATAPDPVTISDYKATFDVASNGDLKAVESITTEFPDGRHGIFRFWDLVDPSDSHVRLVPKDIDVRLDQAAVPFELSWQGGRRYRVAKIGDADSFVTPGRHVYTISYTVAGALGPTSAGSGDLDSSSWSDSSRGSTFYWNVIPGGWQMDIAKSTLTVKLPGAPSQVLCAAGQTTSYPCEVRTGDGGEITLTTGALPPRTPVTVRAALAEDEPDRVTLPWAVQWDGVLGRWPVGAVLVLVVSAVTFLLGFRWSRRAVETKPGYPVMYAPPGGMGPVQAFYIAAERLPSNALVATLLYQAERGLTKLTEVGSKDWVIEGTGTPEAWAATDPVTRWVGERLGLTSGGTFAADGSVSSGKTLNTITGELDDQALAWAVSTGLMTKSGNESLGKGLIVVSALAAAALFFFNPFYMSLLALPFAAFTIGGIGLLSGGVGTRRTDTGREAWSRAGGFHRLLSTPSAQDRFDFSAHKELYTAYIPFAVAFDCAEEWAKKYELSVGEPAPMPLWYPGVVHTGYWGGGSTFASFESSVRSSIGAYEATQSSSSSGGGFSGGGGGGGGGGGSW